MNTINQNSIVHVAMDGQSLYANANKTKTSTDTSVKKTALNPISPNGSEAAQDLAQNLAETKSDSQYLQKISEVITGRKLQFNVNKDLGSVVVTVIDSNTNQVLKEIPSEDMQKLKLRLKKVLGSIIDKMV
ncbi:MAG: flagellar protein FlaG [Treponema sp.]|jgi:flagellar protein FlaG|nr:flagellar protein FlaG [Treponema sp.]